MKTAQLTGALLDYWVARALSDRPCSIVGAEEHERCEVRTTAGWLDPFRPSKLWLDGGPLLDRFDGMVGRCHPYSEQGEPNVYVAEMGVGLARYRAFGSTRLVAAMRALVGAVFGGDVPDETPAWVPPFLEKTV